VSDKLGFTGDRFLPGACGEIWYEHWHRDVFAARIIAGRKVLDVACGAGYGSAYQPAMRGRSSVKSIAPNKRN
jgi:hypothetical protein